MDPNTSHYRVTGYEYKNPSVTKRHDGLCYSNKSMKQYVRSLIAQGCHTVFVTEVREIVTKCNVGESGPMLDELWPDD